MLDFMEQETAYMKNRISKVVDGYDNNTLLDWAENYQAQIILKEEAIDLLKQDINAQEKRLASEYLYDGQQLRNEILRGQVQLRMQMNYVEDEFHSMKKSFNEYLAHNVLHD
mgnify:CR=1 FL=1